MKYYHDIFSKIKQNYDFIEYNEFENKKMLF